MSLRSRAWLAWFPLMLGAILAACGGGEDYNRIRNLQSLGRAVVCFGDSLTEGVGAGPGQDYPSILSQRIGLPVVNAGHRGDTTAQALARLSRDVLDKNPRLVIVLLGGNDFLRQIPLHETRRNLEDIVRRVQAAGAIVVVAGIRLGLLTDEYSPMFEDLAARFGALHVPQVMKGILSDSKLKSDGIHPNGAGYRLMAGRIAEKVQPLLEEADRRSAGRRPG